MSKNDEKEKPKKRKSKINENKIDHKKDEKNTPSETSSVDKTNENESFLLHLDRIKKAKQKTDKIISKCDSSNRIAKTTLELVWEILFDYLCSYNSADLGDINTISSIIHKLTASLSQITNIERKNNEQIQDEKNSQENTIIPEETIKQIEDELNLL